MNSLKIICAKGTTSCFGMFGRVLPTSTHHLWVPDLLYNSAIIAVKTNLLKHRKFKMATGLGEYMQSSQDIKLLLEKDGTPCPTQQWEISVFATHENYLAFENLTMKTRIALCHIQVVILHSKTSLYI